MENTQNNQTQNIIIGSVIVLLIAGGAYYSNQKTQTIPTETDTSESDVVVDNIDTTPTKSADTSTKKPVANTNTVDTTNVLSPEKKISFDAALTQGSNAYNQGDYGAAITYYKTALKYSESDIVYVRLYTIYNIQGDTEKAGVAINTAIRLNPAFTDYWSTKLLFLDQKTNTSYADLKKIYEEGLTKVNPKTKVNLVIQFAGVAEANGQISDAVSMWTYAKTLFSENASAFQAEIDRLNIPQQ